MFIDDYQREEFSAFAEENGYELVDYQKKTKKQATFLVTLKIKGTDVELDFMVTDYEFKSLNHRTRGLTESITKKWQEFNKTKHELYSSCLQTGIGFLPF